MTYEEKVQFLGSYRAAWDKQVSLLNEIEQWRTMATHITPNLTGMPGGGGAGGNKIETATEHIADLRKQLADQVARCIARRAAVEQVIDGVSNQRQQNMLRMVYINGYCWPEICARTGYDERNARRLRARAVQGLYLPDDDGWSVSDGGAKAQV